jgi:hemolysin III
MSAPAAPHASAEEKLSLPLFVLTIVVSLSGFFLLFRFFAPHSVWFGQLSAGAWQFVAAFVAVKLATSFVEYFFHRYVLHKPVIPFLSKFYKQHTLHHNITRIGRRRTPGGRDVPYVENIYPITTPEQGEASFFPWYTLAVFGLIYAPVFALLQWIAPAFPWFFAGWASLATSLAFYEIFHAIEHWSFERWAPLIEHPRWGFFWRKVYSFHLRHHAVIDCNEAISGFFTLPVPDFVFGTWIFPKSLYADGGEWEESEFKSPRPYRFIRWCDKISDEMVQHRRLEAQGAPLPVAEPIIRNYSAGERLVHRITDSVGLSLGAASLALLIVFACLRGNAWHIASFSVFGVSLVLLYTVFGLYHSLEAAEWRRVLRQYNHAAVFLLIAGTSTPFLLVGLRGAWGWSLFGLVWGLCTVGMLFRLLFAARYRLLSSLIYVLVGVLAVIAIKPVVATLPAGGLWLMLAGVVCYLGSLAFYVWRLPRYELVPRQIFAIGGSVCHMLAAVLFLLPSPV